MQESGGDCLRVKPELSQQHSHFYGMIEVRFAGQPHLSLVNLGGKNIGLLYKIKVSCGVVGGNPFYDVLKPNHFFMIA